MNYIIFRMPLWVGIILFAVLIIVAIVISIKDIAEDKQKKELELAEQNEQREIKLAKQDILTQYKFEAVIWFDAEKVENLEGRDDFYYLSCLVEDDELTIYRFAVTIREVNGEIDVDTWMIKEGQKGDDKA